LLSLAVLLTRWETPLPAHIVREEDETRLLKASFHLMKHPKATNGLVNADFSHSPPNLSSADERIVLKPIRHTLHPRTLPRSN
jgi:hypothetical protein